MCVRLDRFCGLFSLPESVLGNEACSLAEQASEKEEEKEEEEEEEEEENRKERHKVVKEPQQGQ